MIHRYLAGILVLLVVALNWMAWRGGEATRHLRGIATFTLGLILFQAALGMWTVTLKLKPVIVMAHLLGGMATLSLLSWQAFRSKPDTGTHAPSLRSWVLAGLAILVIQIALGGWTSANYAALACPDFPQCTGQWWPQTDFREGFVIWREIGVDYEGGVLDQDARAAIHLAHRMGAIVALLVLLGVAIKASRVAATRSAGFLLGGLVCVQVTLGILNIVLKLPLLNAVAHNGAAALLLATLVWLLHRTSNRPLI
jgi:cytochrome c oxidase assembly protein subunit 15